ncbi:CRISPR locus-related DNA-binding protein [Candidatus Bathyarchaeota archaeon]|nr:CRISPR locus-related DNA-binding protein [Candidatus Bathyarchaeota archaeon]
MSKSIIVTFGWTEYPVIGSIIRHGLESKDKVILLIPADKDERTEKAINDLKAFTRNIPSVELIEERIDISNFLGTVIRIKTILERCKDRIIVNLSGGMRILVLATYLASLFTKNVEVEVESENRKFRVYLPSVDVVQLMKLKNKHLRVLDMLQQFKGECLVGELMRMLKFSRSTLYACIKDLRDMDLVKKTNRKGKIRITNKGILVNTLLGR